MGEVIRIEEMKVSDEEKKLIIRALTDKKFRDELEAKVAVTGESLDDDQLKDVVGGITMLSASQILNAISVVKYIDTRISAGAEVLCGGGPCGIG